MGVLDGWTSSKGKGQFWVNVGHPILTNGGFVAQLFSAMRGGTAAVPKLLWDFLLGVRTAISINHANKTAVVLFEYYIGYMFRFCDTVTELTTSTTVAHT